MNRLFDEICAVVGKERASMRMIDREAYSHDISPLPGVFGLAFDTLPDIVVRPANSDEVSRVVKLAYKERVPVIPRGAATWGLGGAVPCFGGIILDMTSLNRIISVDKERLCMTVETGATWKAIDDRARKEGLSLGAFPSSAPAATVGGWLGTGGVGIGSLKYGGAGEQVRSLEVILSDGTVVNTGFDGVVSNSSGYDLTKLFVGAEGTLGIITRATIKLRPLRESLKVSTFDFHTFADACEAMRAIANSGVRPWHVGYFDFEHYRLKNIAEKAADRKEDFEMRVTVAFEGAKEVVDIEMEVCKRLAEGAHGRMIGDEEARQEWDERYYEFRAKKLGPTIVPYEVFIPLSKLKDALEETKRLAKSLKLTVAIGGTVCDENTSALMPYYFTDDAKVVRFLAHLAFTKKLADASIRLGGHPAGLGLFYAPFLQKRGNVAEAMTNVKNAFDPKGIMNPGKLLESSTRYGFNIPPFAFRAGLEIFGISARVLPKNKLKVESAESATEKGARTAKE